tara:strand:+ start:79 stop:504 length:426 start_codon:yes stop_codon:yes gene_type:complete
MKKTELKTMIREIVREEVRMELRSYLKEFKKKQTKLVERPTRKKQIKKQSQKYTNNSVLNKVLNETANSEDWKTLGDEPFTTGNMSDILNKSYDGRMSDDQMIASTGANPESIPDHVSNALTKDYSELMKTIEKKKNGSPL